MKQDYVPSILIKLHSTSDFRWVWFDTCRILKFVYSENALQMIKNRNTEKTTTPELYVSLNFMHKFNNYSLLNQ